MNERNEASCWAPTSFFLGGSNESTDSDFLQNTVSKGVCFISKVEPAFPGWPQMIQLDLNTWSSASKDIYIEMFHIVDYFSGSVNRLKLIALWR